MIYLARDGKQFGPFSADELGSSVMREYSWILDLRDAAPAWRPLDPQPSGLPARASPHPEVLVYCRQLHGAVSGSLEDIRLRHGILVTSEAAVRLEPGSMVEVQILGKPAFPATVERVEYTGRKARYRLGWQPAHAPG